jgi:hypothetical protein
VAKRGDQLPLDSPAWIPIAEAHRALLPLTGSRDLAAQDLSEVVADGSVPCMRRRLGHGDGPKRELIPLPFWKEYWFMHWSDIGLQLMNRPANRGPSTVATYRGFAFFVWKPALARIWPAAFAPATAAPSPPMTTEVLQSRRGPKPKGDWRIELAARLIRTAATDPKALQNADALVKTMASEFGDAGLFLPSDAKRIRAEIVLLLKHVRR